MKKLLLILLVISGLQATAGEYVIDGAHSHVMFKIKHMTISSVTGRFEKFKGSFTFDPKHVEQSTGNVTIDVNSVNTDVADRDKHLKSPEFFDVAKYPEMIFKSTKVIVKDKNHFQLKGNLTLHGVTRAITLNVEYGGTAVDPWGNTRVAFSATGKLNRKDYGLMWNKLLETGGLLVGEEVTINIEVEAILQK